MHWQVKHLPSAGVDAHVLALALRAKLGAERVTRLDIPRKLQTRTRGSNSSGLERVSRPGPTQRATSARVDNGGGAVARSVGVGKRKAETKAYAGSQCGAALSVMQLRMCGVFPWQESRARTKEAFKAARLPATCRAAALQPAVTSSAGFRLQQAASQQARLN